jgi:hypothetical protein
MMIILTQDQANQVRGYHVLGHALAPVPLKNSATSNASLNGMLMLPEECIDDPVYAFLSDFLKTLPTYLPDDRIVAADASTDPTVLSQCSYSASWPLGVVQSLTIIPPVAPAPNSDAQYLSFTQKQLAKAQSSNYWQIVYAPLTNTDQYMFAIWVSQIDSKCMGEVTTAQLNAVWPLLTTQQQNYFNANKLAYNNSAVVAFFNQNPPPVIG